jgi:hypothetical protein
VSAGTGRTLLGTVSLASILAALALLSAHSADLDWLIAYVHRLTATAPLGFWTVLLGMLIGWVVIIRINWIPSEWLPMTRRGQMAVAQMVGSVATFSVIYLWWDNHVSALVALLFGLASPLSLSCVLATLELLPCAITRRLAAEVRGDPKEPK